MSENKTIRNKPIKNKTKNKTKKISNSILKLNVGVDEGMVPDKVKDTLLYNVSTFTFTVKPDGIVPVII